MSCVTQHRFSLLEESWIPCISARGKPESLGLAALFERAAEIRELSDPSPLARTAMLRLLLAVLYRTQAVGSTSKWRRLWSDGWDHSAIQAHFEQWSDRFDLFSARAPFFQRPELDENLKPVPLTKMSPEFTAGNNKLLFDHSCDEEPPAFSPADAARLLVTCQCWSIGGGVSGGGRPNFTTAALPKGACLLPIGKNLRETLLLNLAPLGQLSSVNRRLIWEGKEDAAAWEQAPTEASDSRNPLGPADYLTWQTRYVRLLPEEDGTVRHAYLVQGEKMDFGDGADVRIDPMHSYRRNDKGAVITCGVSVDRALWRDSESLFVHHEDGGASIAPALHALDLARRDGAAIRDVVPVLVTGVAIPGGQPPPDLWCADLFSVPLTLVSKDGEKVAQLLKEALDLAQSAATVLRRGVYAYANKYLEMLNGSGDPKAIGNLTNAISREGDYWAALEAPFHELLPGLADKSPSLIKWTETVRVAVIAAFEASLASQDETGRHHRAASAARATFFGAKKGIPSIFPKEEES